VNNQKKKKTRKQKKQENKKTKKQKNLIQVVQIDHERVVHHTFARMAPTCNAKIYVFSTIRNLKNEIKNINLNKK
jgi:hypothetical protein